MPTARFDHLQPSGEQERKILYAASRLSTAVAEVFQVAREIDRSCRQPWLVGFETVEDLIFLDLTVGWPTATGASMAIRSGPRPRARRWSQAIYDAYPHIQGLWYPSSMDANCTAIARYERSEAAMPSLAVFHRPLTDPALSGDLTRLALALRYGLA